jgi:hypothetical protein
MGYTCSMHCGNAVFIFLSKNFKRIDPSASCCRMISICPDFVNTVINLGVALKEGNFFTFSSTVSLTRSRLLHSVRCSFALYIIDVCSKFSCILGCNAVSVVVYCILYVCCILYVLCFMLYVYVLYCMFYIVCTSVLYIVCNAVSVVVYLCIVYTLSVVYLCILYVTLCQLYIVCVLYITLCQLYTSRRFERS